MRLARSSVVSHLGKQGLAGVEFYLVEQEGYDLPEFETAEKCLANFKKLRSL